MSDLNSYSFTGRLGADAEVKYTASGTAIWSARVAVGYGYGDNKGTNWVTTQMFGKRAEGLGKLELLKGAQIAACGELRLREYTKNDGTKGYATEVNASDVHVLSSAQPAARQAPAPAPQRSAASHRQAAAPAPVSNAGFDDDDIPF